jgi:hypothetical protein
VCVCVYVMFMNVAVGSGKWEVGSGCLAWWEAGGCRVVWCGVGGRLR